MSRRPPWIQREEHRKPVNGEEHEPDNEIRFIRPPSPMVHFAGENHQRVDANQQYGGVKEHHQLAESQNRPTAIPCDSP